MPNNVTPFQPAIGPDMTIYNSNWAGYAAFQPLAYANGMIIPASSSSVVVSAAGGGPNNTADHTDANNSYLTAAFFA